MRACLLTCVLQCHVSVLGEVLRNCGSSGRRRVLTARSADFSSDTLQRLEESMDKAVDDYQSRFDAFQAKPTQQVCQPVSQSVMDYVFDLLSYHVCGVVSPLFPSHRQARSSFRPTFPSMD
jgi:hypothetical protein